MWLILKKTVLKWFGDNVFEHAAALAFYALFSLAPIFIIGIALAGFFFGEEAARGNVYEQMRHLLGYDASLTIEKAIQSASLGNRGIWATLLGFFLLIIGSTTVFSQLKSSLNFIWRVGEEPRSSVKNYFKNRLVALVVVLGVGLLFLLSLLMTTFLSFVNGFVARYASLPTELIGMVNVVGFTLMAAILFAMLFKILPDVVLRWRDVALGATVTAILFSLGRYLIALYIRHNSLSNIYGAAGSLVVVLLWIYYSSLILFLGAVFTQVYATHRGHPLYLEKNAVWVGPIKNTSDPES